MKQARPKTLCKAAIALTAAIAALGAQADIKWIEKDYDFGLMKEIAGPKTGVSRFVNLGPDTVSVFFVKPSCGCTSAEFSDEPLAPGDTAVISYTYDPNMRPGRFDKSVKVSLSDRSTHSIKIKGNVLGTPESLAVLYPVEAGPMRLTESSINAKEVVMGHSPIYFISAYSLSADSLAPEMKALKPGLVINPSAPKAGPADVITYSLNFDSRKHGVYGPVEIPVTYLPDATMPDSAANVTFRAFVIPDTNRLMTLQKGKNPRARLESEVLAIEGGDGSRGVSKGEFTLVNDGNGPLHILRIASETGGVEVVKTPKEIKAGKKAQIKLEIDRSKLPGGAFRIPVHIVTDDPFNPRIALQLTGMQ